MAENVFSDDLMTFSVVLHGKKRDLEEIEKVVEKKYVDTGKVKRTGSMYQKKEIHLLTEEQWKEYQKLKQRDARLIGAGFP